jgi:two-component system response regulator PrrA
MKTTVLVVDDEADVREGWAKALKLAGFSVRSAATPNEAITLAEEHSFDVVILDFIMPGMTGLELLVRLREKLPYLRSVIVSGKLDASTPAAEISQNLKAAVEADVYLHKPCMNDELIEAISGLVSKQDDETWQDIAQHAISADRPSLKDARSFSKQLKHAKKK